MSRVPGDRPDIVDWMTKELVARWVATRPNRVPGLRRNPATRSRRGRQQARSDRAPDGIGLAGALDRFCLELRNLILHGALFVLRDFPL